MALWLTYNLVKLALSVNLNLYLCCADLNSDLYENDLRKIKRLTNPASTPEPGTYR